MIGFADYRAALVDRLAARPAMADVQVEYARTQAFDDRTMIYFADRAPGSGDNLRVIDSTTIRLREDVDFTVVVQVVGADESQRELDQQCQALTTDVIAMVYGIGPGDPLITGRSVGVAFTGYTSFTGPGEATGVYASRCEIELSVTNTETEVPGV